MMKQYDNMIFGIHPVMEALHAGREIDKVMIKKGLEGAIVEELRHLLRKARVPQQAVPIEKLNSLTNKNHQGVIAFASLVSYQRLSEVLTTVQEQGKMPLIVILDDVTDVRNFGAIARSAETAGAHAIVVPMLGSAQINADALKTSAGALNHIAVCREAKIELAVKFLKTCGVQIVAATEKAPRSIYEANFKRPTAIVMGSEETGISRTVLEHCDVQVSIPVWGKVASLNVSNAATVVLYEAVRQRMQHV